MPAVRFLPIASGSKGNCYYIETPHARVLLDCGIGIRRLTGTLRDHGVEVAQLDAVLVTHTHSDHVGGIGALLARQPLAVFVHHRQAGVLDRELRRQGLAEGLEGAASVHPFNGEGFPFRDLDILPVPVSHDCEPTVAFAVWCGGVKLGVLTDLGVWEPEHLALFADCTVLVLESNHCPQMLRSGPYPPFLKARIAGARGHLSNAQALEFTLSLGELPRHLLLGHLSDNNNTPAVVGTVFGGMADRQRTAALEQTSLQAQMSASRNGLFQCEPGPAAAAEAMPWTAPVYAEAAHIPHTVLTQLTPGPLLDLAGH
jgi:phosphoribosyl 1,2-cyclic phosphodiesterase